jgi:hypothetical protein
MIKINTTTGDKMVIPQHKVLAYLHAGFYAANLIAIRIAGEPYNEQKKNIDSFLRQAKVNPNVLYKVTSNFKPQDDLAPMFALAPMNVVFPHEWKSTLGVEKDRTYWYG